MNINLMWTKQTLKTYKYLYVHTRARTHTHNAKKITFYICVYTHNELCLKWMNAVNKNIYRIERERESEDWVRVMFLLANKRAKSSSSVFVGEIAFATSKQHQQSLLLLQTKKEKLKNYRRVCKNLEEAKIKNNQQERSRSAKLY